MELVLLLFLQWKHLICDWIAQTDYEIAHKGTYTHPGGISHSAKHVLLTFIVVLFFAPSFSIPLALCDGFLHYHIDWLKQNLVKQNRWTPTDKEFWAWIGIDQCLHQFTYIAIAGFIALHSS